MIAARDFHVKVSKIPDVDNGGIVAQCCSSSVFNNKQCIVYKRWSARMVQHGSMRMYTKYHKYGDINNALSYKTRKFSSVLSEVLYKDYQKWKQEMTADD